MSAVPTFLATESKRVLPFTALLAVSSLFLLALHRLAQGSWTMTKSSLWGANFSLFVAYVLAPLVALGIAALAWGIDRWRGSESWLYSRPLGTTALFALRTLVLIAGVGLALVLALGSIRMAGGSVFHLSPWGVAGAVLLALGIGSFASSMTAGPLGAIVGSILLGSGFAALFPGMLLIAPMTWTTLDRIDMLSASFGAYAAVAGAALLAATWATVQRAPADPASRKKGLLVAGVGLVLAAGVGIAALAAPSRLPTRSLAAVRLLGSGAELRMGQVSRSERARLTRPEVVDAKDQTTVVRGTFAWPEPAYPSPETGEALILDGSTALSVHRWVLLHRDGGTRSYDLIQDVPRGRWPDPFGWSPDGSHFAWGNRRSDGTPQLIVLGPDRELAAHALKLPEGMEWRAAWLDEDTLLIAPLTSEYDRVKRKIPGRAAPWYAIVAADGTVVRGVTTVSKDWHLSLPAFSPEQGLGDMTPIPHRTNHPVPRRGNKAFFWLAHPRSKLYLYSLDLSTYALAMACSDRPCDTGNEDVNRAVENSLTSLDDGSLVWLEYDWTDDGQSDYRVMRQLPSGELEQRCTIPKDGERSSEFYLGRSGSWVLYEGSLRFSVRACNLETGQAAAINDLLTRRIDFEAGELITPDGRIDLAELPAKAEPSFHKLARKP